MDSEEKSCPSRGELAKAGRRCLRHVVLRCPEPVVCSSKGVAALGSVAQLPHYALGRGLETVTPAILFTVNFRIFFDFFDRSGGSPNFKIKKKKSVSCVRTGSELDPYVRTQSSLKDILVQQRRCAGGLLTTFIRDHG